MYNFQIHMWLTFCFVGILIAEPVVAQRTWNDNSIRREQAELRQELDALERESRSIKDRLRNLDQIVEVQKELDRVVTQLKEARSSSNRVKTERLQSRVNPLMRHLDDLREALEAKGEPTELQNNLDSRLEIGQSGQLKSGEYFVTQSWSQEENFRRPYFVNVPNQPARKKLPVLIFLHGNGGNAQGAMRGFLRGRKKIASQFILVFAQGYRESWNIVSERSKADDLGFIEAIVTKLSSFENVDSNNFTIMGSSNGAALVNQIAIESKLPNIRNYISGVSQLNVWQYDGKNFKAKGNDNNYRKSVAPATGKRLLNISGAKDNLVPYEGGNSRGIPAKNGKLGFVAAEKSTFLWARQMGYGGEQLTQPSDIFENVEVFRYLDGNVIHYKVTNEGHGATHGISEELLLSFLLGEKTDLDN